MLFSSRRHLKRNDYRTIQKTKQNKTKTNVNEINLQQKLRDDREEKQLKGSI